MQVEYLARISLPDEGWDVNMLEQRDREVVALAEGDNKGKVTTRLGIIGFRREKVTQGNGKGSYPLV